MFGKKKRIIETQAALIADLGEQNKLLSEKLQELSADYKELQSAYVNKCQIINHYRAHYGINIDFPNSEKGGSDHTGSVNVSDILNL